jgi:hypothetical protein
MAQVDACCIVKHGHVHSGAAKRQEYSQQDPPPWQQTEAFVTPAKLVFWCQITQNSDTRMNYSIITALYTSTWPADARTKLLFLVEHTSVQTCCWSQARHCSEQNGCASLTVRGSRVSFTTLSMSRINGPSNQSTPQQRAQPTRRSAAIPSSMPPR